MSSKKIVEEQKVDVPTLQKRVAELEKLLREEKKDCIEALRQRDHNGRMWRIFEIACNQNGCWPHDVLQQWRRLNGKRIAHARDQA